MHPVGAYDYSADLPATAVTAARHRPSIEVYRGSAPRLFPDPSIDSLEMSRWQLEGVDDSAPISIFTPERDARRLTFSRIGDAGRRGLFRLVDAPGGSHAFHLELPIDAAGKPLPDYTASLIIRDAITSQAESISADSTVRLKVRTTGTGSIAYLTLMEDDGTSWSAPIDADGEWREISLPLTSFRSSKGVLLPEGFPGEWNYWVGPAAGRGSVGDHPRLDHVERLQLSLRREEGARITAPGYGVEVESVLLRFAP
jgi:hypothetical protein